VFTISQPVTERQLLCNGRCGVFTVGQPVTERQFCCNGRCGVFTVGQPVTERQFCCNRAGAGCLLLVSQSLRDSSVVTEQVRGVYCWSVSH
jgi:hypothetical protein